MVKINANKNNIVANKLTSIPTQKVRLARSVVEYINKLASLHQFIEFEVNQRELNALSKLGTQLLPRTRLNMKISVLGAFVSNTTLHYLCFTQYIDVNCCLFKKSGNDLSLGRFTRIITLDGCLV
jgi:hypothetical protein